MCVCVFGPNEWKKIEFLYFSIKTKNQVRIFKMRNCENRFIKKETGKNNNNNGKFLRFHPSHPTGLFINDFQNQFWINSFNIFMEQFAPFFATLTILFLSYCVIFKFLLWWTFFFNSFKFVLSSYYFICWFSEIFFCIFSFLCSFYSWNNNFSFIFFFFWTIRKRENSLSWIIIQFVSKYLFKI